MAHRRLASGPLLATLILSAAVLIAPAAAKRRHGNNSGELDCSRMPGCLACEPKTGAAGSGPADGPTTGPGLARPAAPYPAVGGASAASPLLRPPRGGLGGGAAAATPGGSMVGPAGRGASPMQPPAAQDDEEPVSPDDNSDGSASMPGPASRPAAGGRFGRGSSGTTGATAPVTAPTPGRNLLGAAQTGPPRRPGPGGPSSATTANDEEDDSSDDVDAAASDETAPAPSTPGGPGASRPGRTPLPGAAGVTAPSTRMPGSGADPLGLGGGSGLGPNPQRPPRAGGRRQPGADPNDAAGGPNIGALGRPATGMIIIVRQPGPGGDRNTVFYPRPGGSGPGTAPSWPGLGGGAGAGGLGARPFYPYPGVGAGSGGLNPPGGAYGGRGGAAAPGAGGWEPYVGNRPRKNAKGQLGFTCTSCKSPKYDLTEDGVCVCAAGYGNIVAGQRQGSVFPLLPPPPCKKCPEGYVSAGGLAAATTTAGPGAFGYGPRAKAMAAMVECTRCEQGTRPNKAGTTCV